jgi:hypothetical protein
MRSAFAAIACLAAAGCQSLTFSPPIDNGRSAINQRVATAAIERALRTEGLSFAPLSGKRVRVEVGGTSGGYEESYVRSTVSEKIARVGAIPVSGDVPADATLLVSVRDAGTDLASTGGLVGNLLAFLFYRVAFEGHAKLRMIAVEHSGRVLLDHPNLEGQASFSRVWLLILFGPFGWDDSDDSQLDT